MMEIWVLRTRQPTSICEILPALTFDGITVILKEIDNGFDLNAIQSVKSNNKKSGSCHLR